MQKQATNRPYEQALVQARQPDPERRAEGVSNLGVFGNAETVPILKAAVNDSAEIVRVSALFSLVLLGDKPSVAKLAGYLSHARAQFRKKARIALENATEFRFTENPEEAERSAKALQQFQAWWRAEETPLNWDPKKKRFVKP